MTLFRFGQKIEEPTTLVMGEREVEITPRGKSVTVFVRGGAVNEGLTTSNGEGAIAFLLSLVGRTGGILARQPKRGDFTSRVWSKDS